MIAPSSRALLVATLLGGEGHTGVERHVHQIIGEARSRCFLAELVTPYSGPRIGRAPLRPLKNFRADWAQALYRRGQARAVRARLSRWLREHPGVLATLYAQCPLTTGAAAGARPEGSARIVAAVHYNESEAAETVARGAARPGGPWAALYDRAEQRHLPRANRIVFVSDYMRRVVNARVPDLAAVPQTTLPNFAAPPSGGRSPVRGDLISIGSLEPRKNQAYLLEVLAECRKSRRNYSLTIAGAGPDLGQLQELSRRLGLESQVRFLGSHPGASALIPGHRALVHAAKAENCPVIIAEALAAGRPVVASPVGGIPEMFRDHVEGRYWPLDQPGRAAETLIALLDDAETYAAAAAAALRRYEEVFSDLADRWIRLLLPA